MRRRRLSGPNDSLDLLLDTICNAFGGIIFIAVLIAMLARDSSGPSPGHVTEKADHEMTQRAIDHVLSEIAQYQKIAGADRSNEEPLTNKLQEIETLKRRLSQLEPTAAAPGGTGSLQPEIVRIRAGAKEDQAMLEQLLKRQEDMAVDIAKMKSLTGSLATSIQQAKNQRTENLRFPRQNTNTNRRPYFIFVREQSIFSDFTVSLDVQDSTRFHFEELPGKRSIMPKNGMGTQFMEGRSPALEARLRAVDSTNFFIYVVLYPDSYDTWRDLRRLLISVDLDDYGITFFEQNQPLVLVSEGGSAILPQGGG